MSEFGNKKYIGVRVSVIGLLIAIVGFLLFVIGIRDFGRISIFAGFFVVVVGVLLNFVLLAREWVLSKRTKAEKKSDSIDID
jgi:Flp pilus assembly protein TadB